jgi:hypothetical protein
MRSFLVALLAVSCFAAETEFELMAKANLTGAKDFFKFRASALATVNVPMVGGILGWGSVAAGGSILNASVSADIIAAVHVTGTKIGVDPLSVRVPPLTVGTYVAGSATFDFLTFASTLVNGQLDAGLALGVVGFAVPGVIEVDSDGKFVSGIAFSEDWGEISKVSGTPAGLSVFKTTLKDTSKATVTEYTAASEVAGYLKFGKTPVTPNSLEVIYEINNYKYDKPGNHLELVLLSAVVTAEGKGTVNASAAVNELANGLSTYAGFRAEATVDGKQDKVTVSIAAEADLNDLVKVAETLKAKLSAAFKARGVVSFDYRKVPFPAGAKNIIYDPAIGAGKNVYNSASSVVLSVLAVLLAVFLLF